MMASLIETAEDDDQPTSLDAFLNALGDPSISETIARAAADAADALNAPMLFTFTSSGSTALSVARMRPKTPIICVSEDQATLRKMQLIWGLSCHQAPALNRVAGRGADSRGPSQNLSGPDGRTPCHHRWHALWHLWFHQHSAHRGG